MTDRKTIQEKERLVEELGLLRNVALTVKDYGLDEFVTDSPTANLYRFAAQSVLTNLANTKIGYYIGTHQIETYELLQKISEEGKNNYIYTNYTALWHIVSTNIVYFIDYVYPMILGDD